MDFKAYFKGKRITVMGLGLLGRGIGDVRFLSKQGAILTVTDLKTKEQLASSLKELKGLKNITYVLGEHRLEDFRDEDMVIKAAGVPLDSPYIEEARKASVPIEMSTSLFARLTLGTIIGITGTRGKSTVTHLLHEVLKTAYKGKKYKVYLGGNVRGMSTLELLPKVKKGDFVVLELDSWQLQGFGESKLSPHLAIFTTFMNDHLNYYKGDIESYFEDKANIYRFQKQGDILIMGSQMSDQVSDSPVSSTVVDESDLPDSWELRMPGVHNRYNAALVLAAAESLGIKQAVVKKVVESFKGVPGRLELIRTVKGVKFYNDTTATTPDGTIAALKAIPNPVLIMGGADKYLNMNELMPLLKKHAKAVICLPGTGTDRIMKDPQFLECNPEVVGSMKEAVLAAYALVKKGGPILMSPAFASFGLFKNEFDRGDQFVKIVKKLK